MDKELKNKDLEEVSGGSVIIDPPGPQPQPAPMPQPQPQPTPKPQPGEGPGEGPGHTGVDLCKNVVCCPFSSKSECPAAYIKKNCKYN